MQPIPAPALSLPPLVLGDRSLFPHLQPSVFLNHAAISPPSTHVERAVTEAMRDFARHGVGAVGRWVAQRERLRGKLARLVGREAQEIGLVKTTSDGVVAVAQAIDWQRGDKIVLCQGEFPTNVTPWLMAAKQYGLEVRWVPADSLVTPAGLEALGRVLAQGVRLMALSAVQFQTGLRMPFEAIGKMCHDQGAQLFLDAIQAVGVVPLDFTHVDYAAAGSHKWLMGVEGAGFVYMRRDHHDALIPRLASWLSHEDALSFLFEGPGQLRYDRQVRRGADRVEKGALNVLGYAALEASLDLLMHFGTQALFDHAWGYVLRLEEALWAAFGWQSVRQRMGAAPTAIYAVPKPQGLALAAFAEAMSARGVSLSTPDGHIRMAPHWPNDADRELSQVVGALEGVLAGGTGR